MTSPDIFTDRRSDKEPVIKPKKYASTQIVHDLIQSISDSKDTKLGSDQTKRVLRNIRNFNKTGAVRQVDFTELNELEVELLDARRFHKMGVNEMEVCLYSTYYPYKWPFNETAYASNHKGENAAVNIIDSIKKLLSSPDPP
ncbi:unnamed protein product [Caenorhabditis brenneri]